MRTWRWFGSVVLFVASASASAQSRDISVDTMRTEKRVALVIGNASYSASPLKNPVNDARAMAEALRTLGFDVLSRENVGDKDLKRAIEEFGDRLRGGGVGLFFYAGHGVQVGGRNYLMPVNAQINTERDVDIEGIDIARVLGRMEEARNRLNIVILDACRDNPFGRSFRTSTRGLAAIDAPSGTLIAYATAPGRLARDGDGTNGLYTGELLRAIRQPGLRLEDVFKHVRQAVRVKTNGDQIPWEASSVEGDFYFGLPRTAAALPQSPWQIEIREEVRPQTGSLALSASLDAVEVWLDEQRIGETKIGRALIASNVPEGTHKIVARKAGHKEWERDVKVAANNRSEVIIDMEPLTRRVTAQALRVLGFWVAEAADGGVSSRVVVRHVEQGSAASTAGLQDGDVLHTVTVRGRMTAIGWPIGSTNDVDRLASTIESGDRVIFFLHRDGRPQSISFTVDRQGNAEAR